MGADMHVFVEKKNNNNEWEYIYLKNKEDDIVQCYFRNYLLFGALANVRAPEVIGFTKANRGLPDNVSQEIYNKYEEVSYFHNVTWYSFSELRMFKQYIEKDLEISKEKFEIAKQNNANDLEWIEEDYYWNKDLAEAFNNFLFFLSIIADFNYVYNDDILRVIVWFDN